MSRNTQNNGFVIIYALVFGSIFLILLGGLFGFVSLQLRMSVEKTAWSESLHAAEAGAEYYEWCLDKGIEAECALEKDYFDASGNHIGGFLIDFDETISCGETTRWRIVSTGWTDSFPDVKRKISMVYGKISVGKYSYILNDNVWVGADHEIRGPYHSNGGIRMDGENGSLVTSGQEEWVCTSSFGCSSCPTSYGCHYENYNCVCPGVFTTANGQEDLFHFPSSPFSFAGITIDLAGIKSAASLSGVYLPPSQTIDTEADGYHLKFLNNGSFEAWIITDLSSTRSYSLEEGWHYDYFVISDEYLYNTYNYPPDCSVVFAEDNIWAEGEIKGKIRRNGEMPHSKGHR